MKIIILIFLPALSDLSGLECSFFLASFLSCLLASSSLCVDTMVTMAMLSYSPGERPQHWEEVIFSISTRHVEAVQPSRGDLDMLVACWQASRGRKLIPFHFICCLSEARYSHGYIVRSNGTGQGKQGIWVVRAVGG